MIGSIRRMTGGSRHELISVENYADTSRFQEVMNSSTDIYLCCGDKVSQNGCR